MTIMSEALVRLPLASLAEQTGFRLDARFSRARGGHGAPAHDPEPGPEDLRTAAYDEGYAAGLAEAQAMFAEQAKKDAAAREALDLSFSRLDQQMEEEFRLKLRDTVAALCEAAIAPLALDEDLLMKRIDRAAAMFRRADDERVIRLHPDDLALISPRLSEDWHIVPDPALERGGLRVECGNGGVEDGPDVWRRAIAEALHSC